MADDDTICKLLEIYQKCKSKGEEASLIMETMNSKHTITFTINKSAGTPTDRSNCPKRRWKPPSQMKRDKIRKEKFLAKKLENQNAVEPQEIEASAVFVKPKDEVFTECDKIFVIAKETIDNHNIGIEYDVKGKLEAKKLKVNKVIVERKGDQIFGEFIRCQVFIEPIDVEVIKKEDFGIEKCWVLPIT